ncbi:hypothetical protein [uncultured Tateyamaria sp.]|uniref:hypothetical protein n=1 Tax=uncultured Tateyamaria sp. TaxID=455651 RepID=UPI0026314D07|nr:hypothetical protein [uncultured Tateyamaria sp.]
MSDTTKDTVLGRIAAAGREERKARAMTLQKAMRVTLARVADALMELPMAVIGAVVQPVEGDAVEAALSDDKLLLLLDGPGRYAAAATIDPVVVGGLIQQQTMGTVRPDLGDTRAMTRTDAAICAPLLDTLIERVAPILDEPDDRALIEGFRFGAKADDARTLAMSLDAQDYVVIRLTVDVSRGARQGDIEFVLPKPGLMDAAPDDESDDADTSNRPDFVKTVMDLNTDLNMVVCRLQMPLSALHALKVGQELVLPPGHFPDVQISTCTGRIVGKGVVGHVDGVRAVKPQRKPAHATQPLRRASDAPMVDMPEVEDLTNQGRRTNQTAAREEPAPEPIADLPDVTNLPALADDVNMDVDAALPDLDNLPDLTDIPDLADLPDLADMPDLDLKVAS